MQITDPLERLKASDDLKQNLLISKANISEVKKLARDTVARTQIAQSYFKAAEKLLADLSAGKGGVLAEVGTARVYGFWLDVPGYSGPIRGATARLTQHGDVHQVSDVKGTTKGGLGGAAVGAVLLGPAGAIVGAVASRKTTVNTEIRTVDTRKFELEVIGPGFAWSTNAGPKSEYTLKKFRDAVNGRSTSNDDIQDAIAKQNDVVESARLALVHSTEVEQAAAASLADALSLHDKIMAEYLELRLPLWQDLKARVSKSTLLFRILVVVIGPVLLMAWAGYVALMPASDQMAIKIAFAAGLFQFVVFCYLVYFYTGELRPIEESIRRID